MLRHSLERRAFFDLALQGCGALKRILPGLDIGRVEEDLSQPILWLVEAFLDAGHHFIDAQVRHADFVPEAAADQVLPGDVGLDLIAQRLRIDAAGGDVGDELVPGRAVLFGDAGEFLVDFIVADVAVRQLVEFLELDLFLDQAFDRSLLGFFQCGVVNLAAEAEQDELRAVLDVGIRNHLVVHQHGHAIDRLAAIREALRVAGRRRNICAVGDIVPGKWRGWFCAGNFNHGRAPGFLRD